MNPLLNNIGPKFVSAMKKEHRNQRSVFRTIELLREKSGGKITQHRISKMQQKLGLVLRTTEKQIVTGDAEGNISRMEKRWDDARGTGGFISAISATALLVNVGLELGGTLDHVSRLDSLPILFGIAKDLGWGFGALAFAAIWQLFSSNIRNRYVRIAIANYFGTNRTWEKEGEIGE